MPPFSPLVPTPRPEPAPRGPSAEVASAARNALRAEGPIVVALSGGGDSVALLHLLRQVAPERPARAVVIDHALREGSGAEAQEAAAIARDLGATADIVTLAWAEGAPRTQQSARLARHVALARYARAAGAQVVFLGHTRDDQAETVFMRRRAGSGQAGLAGMDGLSPSPVWPEGRGIWLARPLLRMGRGTLRDHLREAGTRWIEDPSNVAQRFERVRVRARLRDSGETDGLIALAAEARKWAMDAHRGVRNANRRCLVLEEGAAAVSPKLLEEHYADLALSVLAVAIGARGRHLPREAAGGLRRRLGLQGVATLGGAVFKRQKDQILVTRDPGGVFGRRGGGVRLADRPLPAAEEIVWDGRLALTASAGGWRAAPASDGNPAAPDLLHDDGRQGGDGEVAQRWLLADRIKSLLWRGPWQSFG